MKSDRNRWNKRYAKEEPDYRGPDPFFLEHRALLSSGSALDVAAGRGGASLAAAELGYSVHAVDISVAAMVGLRREAGRRGLDVSCVVADLDEFVPPHGYYDLVMVFHFYAPALSARIAGSLKRSGLLIYSTYNYRHLSEKPTFNPAYLVPRGGPARAFPDMEILVDEPEAGVLGNLSRLVARKR